MEGRPTTAAAAEPSPMHHRPPKDERWTFQIYAVVTTTTVITVEAARPISAIDPRRSTLRVSIRWFPMPESIQNKVLPVVHIQQQQQPHQSFTTPIIPITTSPPRRRLPPWMIIIHYHSKVVRPMTIVVKMKHLRVRDIGS